MMSVLPERISVKRRRDEDPVDTLYFEQGRGVKRTLTDFCFQRLIPSAIPHKGAIEDAQNADKQGNKVHNSSSITQLPGLLESSPATEARAIQRQKSHATKRALIAAVIDDKRDARCFPAEEPMERILASRTTSPHANAPNPDQAPAVRVKIGLKARKFHLARPTNPGQSEIHSSSPRKDQRAAKSGVATFIERLELPAEAPVYPPEHYTSTSSSENRKRRTNSDNLADELAAFALSIETFDPSAKPSAIGRRPDITTETIEQDLMDTGDLFVFETYVRVPTAHVTSKTKENCGTLVIDETKEGLWQTYLEDDDDSEWDEEDPDSNGILGYRRDMNVADLCNVAEDNPVNDYPEDEVSSDDELNFNSYQHRNYGSDNEEYDIERDENPWSDHSYGGDEAE